MFCLSFHRSITDLLPKVEGMFIERMGNGLSDVYITVGMVLKKLQKLVKNKAPGVDGIMSENLAANADI